MPSIVFNSNQKPNNEQEFLRWFSQMFSFDEKRYKVYYEQTTKVLQEDFVNSDFWKMIAENLREWDLSYYIDKKVHLISIPTPPVVVVKPLGSLLNKAYRKNILQNNNFPLEPLGGWVNQENWFERIHDIIRTSFEVKYLDGVKFLEEKLTETAQSVQCDFYCSYEAREEGYYAAHASLRTEMPLLLPDWTQKDSTIEMEIQITTEFQEMIKSLLHKYYEVNRKTLKDENYKWQWDYQSEQFVPNYLGHIAHYLEGMIVEIRDKQNL